MGDLEAILAPVERAARQLTNCDTCDGLGEVPVMPYHLRTPAELAMRADRQTTTCPACDGSGLTTTKPKRRRRRTASTPPPIGPDGDPIY